MIGARGERLSMRDVMTRFHLCGIDAGFNSKTQFFVTAPDPNVDLSQTRVFTQAHEIHAESLAIVDDNSQWFNVHPYDYRRDYNENAPTEWELTGEARDAQLIADYGGEQRTAERVQLHMVRSLAVAEDIMSWRLRLMGEPPRLVTFDVSLDALDIEPGEIVRVTHLDGIGAQGWQQHPVRVTRHEYDVERLKVRLEAYDANRVLAARR